MTPCQVPTPSDCLTVATPALRTLIKVSKCFVMESPPFLPSGSPWLVDHETGCFGRKRINALILMGNTLSEKCTFEGQAPFNTFRRAGDETISSGFGRKKVICWFQHAVLFSFNAAFLNDHPIPADLVSIPLGFGTTPYVGRRHWGGAGSPSTPAASPLHSPALPA